MSIVSVQRVVVLICIALLVSGCAGPLRGMKDVAAPPGAIPPPGKASIVFMRPSGFGYDFMQADLEAGKTYYALVTPRIGAWRARFSLRPITASELRGKEFQEWFEECTWVETTDDARGWARQHASSVQQKKAEYLQKWEPRTDKPTLSASDGR